MNKDALIAILREIVKAIDNLETKSDRLDGRADSWLGFNNTAIVLSDLIDKLETEQ